MRIHFQHAIDAIHRMVAAAAGRVRDSVRASHAALLAPDPAAAAAALARDRGIDEIEVRIEEECLKAIALHQPVADDLRFLVLVVKIDRELERIGDHAVDIARAASALSLEFVGPYRDDLDAIGRAVLEQLDRALKAFETRDPVLARDVWTGDDRADRLTRALRQRVEGAAAAGIAPAAFRVIEAAHAFERIADHAAAICKEVIHLATGEIVRHSRHAPSPASPSGNNVSGVSI